MKILQALRIASLSLFFCGTALCALDIGDNAPELQITKWAKNGPVKIADGKGHKIYIVEFWATWCPPCRESIPHLSELQKKYRDKGLAVAGISSESTETVEKFVAEQKNMNYHVGIDDNNKTFNAYMTGRDDIPTAFLIGQDGKIIWVGHPMDLEEVLNELITGNANLQKAVEKQKLDNQLQDAIQKKDFKQALLITELLIRQNPGDIMPVRLKICVLTLNKQEKDALQFIDSSMKIFPKNIQLHQSRIYILKQMKNESGILKAGDEFIADFHNDPPALNDFAWELMESAPFGEIPLSLVLKTAETAWRGKFTGPDADTQKSAIADTLAKCYYLLGKLDNAIELEKQSIALGGNKNPDQKAYAEKILAFYQQARELQQKVK